MPPFAAQGANQGFEDAAAISALIAKMISNNLGDDDKIVADRFGKYERLRRPVMLEVQAATMKNHSWSQAEWDNYSDLIYRRDLGRLIDDLL
jgi:2-polyprenyl-6-methoxyphenol hydroxylase-like FAD-dependent oxidoreductase